MIYLLLFRNQYESKKLRNKEILKQIRLLHRIPEEIPLNLCRDSYGKPVILDLKAEISISHTGDYLAVALSDHAVGVDIEKKAACDFKKIMHYMFTDGEKRFVGNDLTSFFHVWTKKESFSKILGKGMSIPFSSFDVNEGNLGVHFVEINIEDDYIGYICYEKSSSSVGLQMINLVEKEK